MYPKIFTIFPVFVITDIIKENLDIDIRFILLEGEGPTEDRLSLLSDDDMEGFPLFEDERSQVIIGIIRKDGECFPFTDIPIGKDNVIYPVAFYICAEIDPLIAQVFACAKKNAMIDIFFNLCSNISQIGVELTLSEKFDCDKEYCLSEKKITEIIESDEDFLILHNLLLADVLVKDELYRDFTRYFLDIGITTTRLACSM